MTPHRGYGSLLAATTAALASLGASACCVLPLLLLSLGLGGSWLGSLTALEAYRPIFVGLTLLFLGLAWRWLYRAPQACASETPCADPRTIRRRRLVFWLVAALLLGLLALPRLAPQLFI